MKRQFKFHFPLLMWISVSSCLATPGRVQCHEAFPFAQGSKMAWKFCSAALPAWGGSQVNTAQDWMTCSVTPGQREVENRIFIQSEYLYFGCVSHIHLWGSWAQVQLHPPCPPLSVPVLSPVSQLKSPKQGPKQDPNAASVNTARFQLQAQSRAGAALPGQCPSLWNPYYGLVDLSILLEVTPKHQPWPASCGAPIFHQELPLTCCSSLQKTLYPSTQSSVSQSTGSESLHTIIDSSWLWQPQYKS